MKVMILAAGYGKRLRPLTDHTPKPLVEIGGKPMIVHHLEKLSTAGFTEAVINLGHLGAKIPDALGDGTSWGMSIAYSDEGPDPLETGGGLAKALPLLGDDTFLVVNGDVWCDMDFASIPKELPPDDDAMLYLVPRPEWRERGDFSLTAEGRVVEDENPQLLYAGLALYHPRILDGAKVEKFSIVPRLKAAISGDRVGGVLHSGNWDDVGTPERLEAIRASVG
ncbi:MAG: nucleotidyltransferase family protein [Opitutae bacterium]|jgi:N-acetyl-alpha-D-muramate 1-phosphate uridylyltransferase|nr:nucleotidyltransferase family protein [Opitutae bacterium]MBT4665378.1 nucleotidyltransferase family protein [Opitutae bacterium]MBT5908398.1 nucleotidyltransferase family protein [Opitutae bacterium]MBT7741850.1 nucleotidyltransferase family protein [Opitutae bacterium]